MLFFIMLLAFFPGIGSLFLGLNLKKPKENQCFWLQTLKNPRVMHVFAFPVHLVTLGAPLGPPRPSSWRRAGSLAGIRFEMRRICNLLRLVESHPPFRREGTAHLYTQTHDSPHACGLVLLFSPRGFRKILFWILIMGST